MLEAQGFVASLSRPQKFHLGGLAAIILAAFLPFLTYHPEGADGASWSLLNLMGSTLKYPDHEEEWISATLGAYLLLATALAAIFFARTARTTACLLATGATVAGVLLALILLPAFFSRGLYAGETASLTVGAYLLFLGAAAALYGAYASHEAK